MRELKFRVWAPVGKKFLYSYKNRGLAFSSSREDSAMEQCGCYDLEQCLDFGFIVQQFSGLKDKSNKEIYEGDILRHGGLIYKIHWNDYKWEAICPSYQKYHWPRFDLTYSNANCSEVVGNIFENSDRVNVYTNEPRN